MPVQVVGQCECRCYHCDLHVLLLYDYQRDGSAAAILERNSRKTDMAWGRLVGTFQSQPFSNFAEAE
jgi:hypothetical protein